MSMLNRTIHIPRTLLALMCLFAGFGCSLILTPGMTPAVVVFLLLAGALAAGGGFVRKKKLDATGMVDAFVLLVAIAGLAGVCFEWMKS
ncbi:MAG: hypothetical protein U0570_00380 [Phycisphaerales bacterium]